MRLFTGVIGSGEWMIFLLRVEQVNRHQAMAMVNSIDCDMDETWIDSGLWLDRTNFVYVDRWVVATHGFLDVHQSSAVTRLREEGRLRRKNSSRSLPVATYGEYQFFGISAKKKSEMSPPNHRQFVMLNVETYGIWCPDSFCQTRLQSNSKTWCFCAFFGWDW